MNHLNAFFYFSSNNNNNYMQMCFWQKSQLKESYIFNILDVTLIVEKRKKNLTGRHICFDWYNELIQFRMNVQKFHSYVKLTILIKFGRTSSRHQSMAGCGFTENSI